jgi:thiamine pyrophosphate-dependent acetolactate synthase large subunit-like protein
MSQRVPDFVVQRLRGSGITRIYGDPSDGINELTSASQKPGNAPRPILTHHQEMAVFPALDFFNPLQRGHHAKRR